MDQTQRSENGDDVEEAVGTLSEDEWIALMNKHDNLEQYATKRNAKQSEQSND
jgi:hypothetical protein